MRQLFQVSFSCNYNRKLNFFCQSSKVQRLAYFKPASASLTYLCLDQKNRAILKLVSVSINLIWDSVPSQVLLCFLSAHPIVLPRINTPQLLQWRALWSVTVPLNTQSSDIFISACLLATSRTLFCFRWFQT